MRNTTRQGRTDFDPRLVPFLCLLSTYMFMPLGRGEDDSQDADELEDGTQKQPIAQQALQKGGLRDLWRGQVQVCRHDAAACSVTLQ